MCSNCLIGCQDDVCVMVSFVQFQLHRNPLRGHTELCKLETIRRRDKRETNKGDRFNEARFDEGF